MIRQSTTSNDELIITHIKPYLGPVALWRFHPELPSYGGWIKPFRLFVFSRRKDATRKDEKTKKMPCEKNEKKKNSMRKDEITPCEKTKWLNPATIFWNKILARKDEKTPWEKTPFETLILSSFRMASLYFFAWRLFVFSLGVILSCRLFAWRLFVFSRRKDAMQKITAWEKTKRRHAKRRKHEKRK